MKVKYIPDVKEYIAYAGGKTYRISVFRGKYLLDEIEPPCGDLSYCAECGTLGEVLEILMKCEVGE